MAQPYDFTLTSGDSVLGFNLAISKDRPYERATAQFRKEQFDSTPTVGDQSLTGWWTRGQLSFHKGNGVTYYEVLEGETVLDRFNSAKGVDPFTPGQVTIGRMLDELDTDTVGIEDCVHVVNYIYGNYLVGRGDDGNLYKIGTGSPFPSQAITQITTETTGDVTAITAARFRTYIAIGKKIEVWYPAMTDSEVLWEKTDGLDFVGMWYAKGRLWVVDENGNWFTLGLDGGTFVDADAEFTIKDYKWLVTNGDTWSLVDSPGPVYISAFNEVYSVTVEDEGGLLPTIGTPVLVAQLPENEYIYCLGYTLSTLAMTTDQGVRFAVEDGNGGVAYGPRLGYPSFSGAQRMAARGTRICSMGEFFDEKGLYSYDLGNLVEALEPAYTLEVPVEDTLGSTGAINTPEGLVAWSSDRKRVYRLNTGSFSAEGSLKTGWHRFGTLDSKWFRSVVVRVGGSGGSVEVFRLDPDGSGYTETSLGTIDVTSGETEAEFDLGPDVPCERVALKFVLNRDDTDETKGPILLGYQLKALPQPRRQRMIRVPLLLMDSESNRSGQTMHADPWDRLAALEALEEENAVVEFSDTETGESGTAYIEAIEVQRGTPPAAGTGGFGGFIYLTLRKVGA